jgi:hypothetical protein
MSTVGTRAQWMPTARAFRAATAGACRLGSTQAQLPVRLRLASAVSIAFYGLAAVVILRRAGFRIGWPSGAVARVGTWVLVVILPLSALVNFLSQSPWERFLMAPTASVLAVLCLLVARSSVPAPSLWRVPVTLLVRRRDGRCPVRGR